MTTILVLCDNCHTELDEKANTPIEKRATCPSCGSTKRTYNVTVDGVLNLHSNLKYKARHQGNGKPFIEGFIGSDLFRKLGKWVRLERVIDRSNDYYKEVVTDPATGGVIHRNQEPLSRHIGHGDDKKNRKK